MKLTKTLLQTAIALTLSFAATSGQARDIVVALSPYETAETIKAHSTQVLELALSLEGGDRVVMLDGYRLKQIGIFTIPSDARYSSARARITKNRPAVAALVQFGQAALPVGESGAPSVIGAVRLPQLLRFVAGTIKGDESIDLIVMGSARYDDPSEPAFSMSEGQFPSDGHLVHSRADTPFGTKGMESTLSGVRVHIAYNDAMLSNDRLAHFVERFWALYIGAQGGELASFLSDRSTVLSQAKHGASSTQAYERDEAADKLEMIRLRPVEMHDSIFERPVSRTPLPQSSLRQAQSVQIGVSWNCTGCDLDLYAKAHPGAQTLYFGHTRSPEGAYWKDYTRSPETVNGYETISYRVPVDLKALVVAVNFYGGSAPDGIGGQLRLSVNGQTYAQAFHMNATRGVRSDGVDSIIERGKSTRPETVLVDVLGIVCFPDGQCG